MKRDELIITIDGPAGVGKSSVSKELAHALTYTYLDTGALYRAVAWKVRETVTPLEDTEKLRKLCEEIDISCTATDNGTTVSVDGYDVSDRIRLEDMSALASQVSAVPVVREMLLPIQRRLARHGGVVVEGRDMGTVVFPDADVKFFLTAALTERAKRRHHQLLEKNMEANYADIIREMEIRDSQDTGRNIAPLKPADDAIVMDTTVIEKNTVVRHMLDVIMKKKESQKSRDDGLLS